MFLLLGAKNHMSYEEYVGQQGHIEDGPGILDGDFNMAHAEVLAYGINALCAH